MSFTTTERNPSRLRPPPRPPARTTSRTGAPNATAVTFLREPDCLPFDSVSPFPSSLRPSFLPSSPPPPRLKSPPFPKVLLLSFSLPPPPPPSPSSPARSESFACRCRGLRGGEREARSGAPPTERGESACSNERAPPPPPSARPAPVAPAREPFLFPPMRRALHYYTSTTYGTICSITCAPPSAWEGEKKGGKGRREEGRKEGTLQTKQ